MNRREFNGFTGVAVALSIGFSGMCYAADVVASRPAQLVAEKPAIAAVTTADNIQTAYLAEMQAKARYNAFAVKADAEGYKAVAVLFRATAASQDVLIKKHAGMLQKLVRSVPDQLLMAPEVKSTKENLEAALAADIGPKNTRYAAFAKQAEADKNTGAMYGFKGAIAAETEYVKYFKLALADLNGWKAEGKTFAVCEVCSFLVMGPPPATCPVCSAPREKFTVIK